MNKGAIIIFAVLIDALQALLSAGIMAIGANAGTVGGVAAGCAAATSIVSSNFSCAAGGLVGGAIGWFANLGIAPITIPLAIGMGFVVNICLTMTLGTFLWAWLWQSGMFYPKHFFSGGLIELVPGVDNVPGFTYAVIRCVIQKSAEEGTLHAGASVAFTAATSGGVGHAMTQIRGVKTYNQSIAKNAGTAGQNTQNTPQKGQQNRVSLEFKNIASLRAKQQKPQEEASQPPYANN